MSRVSPLTALRRTNHAGRSVTLAEGVAVAAGSSALLAARSLRADSLATAGIAALGLADDVLEPRLRARGIAPSKGLRGHLGALRRGRLTTGAAKAFGIPLLCLGAAAAAAARATPGSIPPGSSAPVGTMPGAHAAVGAVRTGTGVLVDAGIAAGAANLANLLDLRPGRALKVTTVGALALALPPARCARAREGRTLAAAAALAGIAALPVDLGERGMLGDTGANALGALVGAAAARRLPPVARPALLLGLGALTLASERVSFSAVIDRSPLLRRIDRWGRRPAADAPAQQGGTSSGEGL
jgi:hypothetical protein